MNHPEHSVTVVERNKPYDTVGYGVVFSDATRPTDLNIECAQIGLLTMLVGRALSRTTTTKLQLALRV